jgi:hypothetical protein
MQALFDHLQPLIEPPRGSIKMVQPRVESSKDGF